MTRSLSLATPQALSLRLAAPPMPPLHVDHPLPPTAGPSGGSSYPRSEPTSTPYAGGAQPNPTRPHARTSVDDTTRSPGRAVGRPRDKPRDPQRAGGSGTGGLIPGWTSPAQPACGDAPSTALQPAARLPPGLGQAGPRTAPRRQARHTRGVGRSARGRKTSLKENPVPRRGLAASPRALGWTLAPLAPACPGLPADRPTGRAIWRPFDRSPMQARFALRQRKRKKKSKEVL